MFKNTVTLFNFHEASGKWYITVIPGVALHVDSSADLTTPGKVDNTDMASLLINCKKDKTVVLAEGKTKTYLPPKAYAKCPDPEAHITFRNECDFFMEGAWSGTEPVLDEEYENGFYHAMNDEQDGVYAIKTSAFLGLIPHFEIGGK